MPVALELSSLVLRSSVPSFRATFVDDKVRVGVDWPLFEATSFVSFLS